MTEAAIHDLCSCPTPTLAPTGANELTGFVVVDFIPKLIDLQYQSAA